MIQRGWIRLLHDSGVLVSSLSRSKVGGRKPARRRDAIPHDIHAFARHTVGQLTYVCACALWLFTGPGRTICVAEWINRDKMLPNQVSHRFT